MKSQGLPMNVLVIGILALLVLVAVVAIWLSGGDIFGGISTLLGYSAPQNTTLLSARSKCNSRCNDLMAAGTSIDSSTAKKTWCEKLNIGGVTYYCGDYSGTGAQALKVSCTVTVNDGIFNGATIDCK